METRVHRRLDFDMRLKDYASSSVSKFWFFEMPGNRDTEELWRELLLRLFYDANVRLHRREPGDPAWLGPTGFRVSPVDLRHMLAWDGTRTAESIAEYHPWITAAHRVVWEFTACYFVDDGGAYDGMEGEDFAELMLYRALTAGQASEAAVRSALAHLYPGHGEAVYTHREQRFARLVGVRPTSQFRKAPGALPWVAGPAMGGDRVPGY